MELASLSPEEVRDLYDPLTPALLEGSRGGEIPGGPAAGWRDVTPLASARHGLELWLAALTALDAGGGVQVCDEDGALGVQITFAEAP